MLVNLTDHLTETHKCLTFVYLFPSIQSHSLFARGITYMKAKLANAQKTISDTLKSDLLQSMFFLLGVVTNEKEVLTGDVLLYVWQWFSVLQITKFDHLSPPQPSDLSPRFHYHTVWTTKPRYLTPFLWKRIGFWAGFPQKIKEKIGGWAKFWDNKSGKRAGVTYFGGGGGGASPNHSFWGVLCDWNW